MITTTTHCVRCRAEIQDGSRFCDACGMPLGPANTSGGPPGAGVSDATRLLAAATISKPQVRTWILKWMSERNRSTPPEIGVDLDFVARVAAFSEARSRQYDYLFAALGIVILVTWGLQLVAVTAFVALCGAGLFLFKSLTERGWLVGHFQRDQFDRRTIEERFTTRLTVTQSAAVPPPGANLTVYSGFSPFVGSGLEMGGWSFALATDKPKDDFRPIDAAAIAVDDLYAAVTSRLEGLHLPGLQQRDHYFVYGRDVSEHAALLPNKYGRPASVMTPELVSRCALGSDPYVRRYRWIYVSDWVGDITVSCFLRCYLRGPTLFVEFKRYLLTPLAASIREIDDLAPLQLRQIIGHAVGALLLGPLKMLTAITEVAGYAREWWDRTWNISARRRRKMIDRIARWDYGASTSVRQAYASGEYVRYFQRADTDSYEKTMEKEILDTLVEFLDARGINTSDLKDRQSAILNHGVIVQNGNINAGSVAVGKGAKSLQQKITKVVKNAARTEGAA